MLICSDTIQNKPRMVAFQAAVYQATAVAKVPASNVHDSWYKLRIGIPHTWCKSFILMAFDNKQLNFWVLQPPMWATTSMSTRTTECVCIIEAARDDDRCCWDMGMTWLLTCGPWDAWLLRCFWGCLYSRELPSMICWYALWTCWACLQIMSCRRLCTPTGIRLHCTP